MEVDLLMFLVASLYREIIKSIQQRITTVATVIGYQHNKFRVSDVMQKVKSKIRNVATLIPIPQSFVISRVHAQKRDLSNVRSYEINRYKHHSLLSNTAII